MDAVEFLKEKERMCNYLSRALEGDRCRNCVLSRYNNSNKIHCDHFIREYPEQAVEIVEEFSEAHPRKTILDDFKEKYPNAPQVQRYPKISPCDLGYRGFTGCGVNCSKCSTERIKCWYTPLEELE